MVFSAYSLALLLALLTTGSLSDHRGRRPVLAGALALEALSMLMLASADGAGALITARILQGAATGAATSAVGAALLDLEDPLRPGRSALTNGIAPVVGMAAGVLGSTLLVHFAPAHMTGVYVVPAVLFAAQAVAVAFTPETARPHAGALRSLRPRLAVPPPARRALLAGGTAVVAIWAPCAASTPPSARRWCTSWLRPPHRQPAAWSSSPSPRRPRSPCGHYGARPRTAAHTAVAGGSLAVLPAALLAVAALGALAASRRSRGGAHRAPNGRP
ncbi:MFS transporter [Streptomyces sp. 147326]|uniref:MFS transporter n=1 Tax=Streptomyces sp. 147326 TaxID=3074379 RepID=UPI0038576F56